MQLERNASIRLCLLHDGNQVQQGTPIASTTPRARVRRQLISAQDVIDIPEAPDPARNIDVATSRTDTRALPPVLGTQSLLPAIPMTMMAMANTRVETHQPHQMSKFWMWVQLSTVAPHPPPWYRVSNATISSFVENVAQKSVHVCKSRTKMSLGYQCVTLACWTSSIVSQTRRVSHRLATIVAHKRKVLTIHSCRAMTTIVAGHVNAYFLTCWTWTVRFSITTCYDLFF